MTIDAVRGLNCPRCGGIVPIPEGQVIVACPYCEQRSVVAASAVKNAEDSAGTSGGVAAGGSDTAGGSAITNRGTSTSLGVRRYQAPLQIAREQAVEALHGFLSGKVQVARDASRVAQLQEAFLVHLPFWAVWGRGVAYAFGQVKVGSGDHSRWEPREKKFVRDLTWNTPACEVGEFGVRQIPLEGCPLQPFKPDILHRSGMVFEPVGAEEAALESARQDFNQRIRDEVKMGRTGQVFTRLVRARLGLVYYPLWVLRYLYRGRAFQVVVDGVNGQVLYGKAPGSVAYRAAVLVGGMAAGAVITLDVPALILSGSNSSHSNDNPFIFALLVFVVGIGILIAAYRTFRYAEQYEYHRFGKTKGGGGLLPVNLPGNLREVGDVISALEKFQ
jgi:hypothetical protein